MPAIAWKIVMSLPSIIGAVEKLVKGKGVEKQNAAVELAKTTLQEAEEILDKDLVDDPLVENATRTVIDAVVNLKNVVEDVKAKRDARRPQA
jgi:hypothetical protein